MTHLHSLQGNLFLTIGSLSKSKTLRTSPAFQVRRISHKHFWHNFVKTFYKANIGALLPYPMKSCEMRMFIW